MQWQVPPTLIFLSYYTFTVLPTPSALHQTHACSTSNASTAKPMVFAFSYHIWNNLPQDIRLLFLSSKANSRHFSSQNISVKQHCPSPLSVCTLCVCVSSQTDGSVCVCVCVCVCVHAHVCAHVCASFTCVDVYKSLKTFFNSMYIMCIILCLFSALSRRVGALQTSIIIKKSHNYKSWSNKKVLKNKFQFSVYYAPVTLKIYEVLQHWNEMWSSM